MKYQEIGNVMEGYVRRCDTGADAWRRTGVLTFSFYEGQNNEKKLTLKRMQQHLQRHYGRKLSYGTVVQLCCARHERRKFSQNSKA